MRAANSVETGRWRGQLLVGLTLAAAATLAVHGPIPHKPLYHSFADERTILGVPHFWNVVSNVPFVLVGVAGAILLGRGGLPGARRSLRPLYGTLFLSTALVGLGSAWYHWRPDDASLVWDRLPMTAGFTSFLAVLIGERIDERLGRRSLVPLLLLGIASVAVWRITSAHGGGGDLRLYVLVQYLSILLVPLIVFLYPGSSPGNAFVGGLIASYVGAKVFELLDRPIYETLGGFVSGHTLKHIAAAIGIGFMLLGARSRVGQTPSR